MCLSLYRKFAFILLLFTSLFSFTENVFEYNLIEGVSDTIWGFNKLNADYEEENMGEVVFPSINEVDGETPIRNIGMYAYGSFSGAGITKVVIPDSVISLGSSIFRGNKIKEAVIGTGIERLYPYTFDYKYLEKVQFHGTKISGRGELNFFAPREVIFKKEMQISNYLFDEVEYYHLESNTAVCMEDGQKALGTYIRGVYNVTIDLGFESSSGARDRYYIKKVPEDYPIKVELEKPSRPGYVFMGWTLDEKAIKGNRFLGEKYRVDTLDLSQPVTLKSTVYALWFSKSPNQNLLRSGKLYEYLIKYGLKDVKEENLDLYFNYISVNSSLMSSYISTTESMQALVDTANLHNAEALFVRHVCKGWNLICTPFSGWSPSVLKKNCFNMFLFSYDEESGGYKRIQVSDVLEPGKGYWLYVGELDNQNELNYGTPYVEYVLKGNYIKKREHKCRLGWNLLGSFSRYFNLQGGNIYWWPSGGTKYIRYPYVRAGHGFWFFYTGNETIKDNSW